MTTVRRASIRWRREAEGRYRAIVDGKSTNLLALRNDNEPSRSPLAWSLQTDESWHPLAEMGSREALTRWLAEHPGHYLRSTMKRDPSSLTERFKKQRAKGRSFQTAYQYAKHGDKELYAAYQAWREQGYSAKEAKRMAGYGPPGRSSVPTLAETTELFRYYRFDDAGKRAAKLHKAMESKTSRKGVDKVLELADKLLETHGVEGIRVPEYQVDNYYYEVVGVYANTGDTYAPTLVYDTENGTYSIEGWGDFVERWENEHPEYRERG